jgi:hypothetical protein
MYKYDSEKGFAAGLRLWLLCIIVLSCLGIRAELSVLFGAAAGASAWLIVAYWKSVKIPDDGSQPAPEPTASLFKRTWKLPDRLRLPADEVKIPNPFARKPRKRI